MDDARLLQAIRSGAPGAFDAFVDRYGRRLMAFGMRMCGQRQDAEDVFQDTLLKAYKSLEDLRDPAALRTWLFRIVANQCRMKRRKEIPSRELPLDDLGPPGWEGNGSPDGEWGEGIPQAVFDWSHLPEAAAERAQMREALETALAELPPDYRMVVLLRDLEGLSTREAADALGLGLSAAKMRLHRGRLALRKRLEQVFQPAGGKA